MIHPLIQLGEQIFVKGCWFLSFAKSMGKNNGKNVSDKCSQKFLDHTNLKNIQQMHLKLFQRFSSKNSRCMYLKKKDSDLLMIEDQ